MYLCIFVILAEKWGEVIEPSPIQLTGCLYMNWLQKLVNLQLRGTLRVSKWIRVEIVGQHCMYVVVTEWCFVVGRWKDKGGRGWGIREGGGGG